MCRNNISPARSFDQLKTEQEDLSDEIAHWATDTLRMRSALDATGVHALLTDEEGVILFVTRTLAAMLGAQARSRPCCRRLNSVASLANVWTCFRRRQKVRI